jgi:hypothetical protein
MEQEEQEQTMENPFKKFASKDSNVTTFTDRDGIVIKFVKGKNYPDKSGKIIKMNDNYIYSFDVKKKYVLNKLTSIPNGIAINKSFFDTFSDTDIFIVEIINNVDDRPRYAIEKSTVLKEGKIRQFPGYEKQIVVSLNFWEKLD